MKRQTMPHGPRPVRRGAMLFTTALALMCAQSFLPVAVSRTPSDHSWLDEFEAVMASATTGPQRDMPHLIWQAVRTAEWKGFPCSDRYSWRGRAARVAAATSLTPCGIEFKSADQAWRTPDMRESYEELQNSLKVSSMQVVAGTRFSDPGAEVSDDVSGQVRDEDILAFGRAAVHTATPTLPSKPHVIIYAAQDASGSKIAGPLFRFVHVICPPSERLCVHLPYSNSTSPAYALASDPTNTGDAQPSCSIGNRCFSLGSQSEADQDTAGISLSGAIGDLDAYIGRDSIYQDDSLADSVDLQGSINTARSITTLALVGPAVIWVCLALSFFPSDVYCMPLRMTSKPRVLVSRSP